MKYDWNENPLINDIYASRYIASYTNEIGTVYPTPFRQWLKSLIVNDQPLSEEDIEFLVDRAMNGKLELEEHVRRFFDK